MANTRRTLERIPEDKFGWKPHEKSMTLGRLASHVAELPGWAKETMTRDALDVAPVGGPAYQPKTAASRQEILDGFDRCVAAGREALAGTTDEQFMQNWTLLQGGKVMFTMPRIAVYRGMVMSHMIHHRAQLGVYLRLNDVPVPAIYGPSADEEPM